MATCDDGLNEYKVKMNYKSSQPLKTKTLRILNLRKCPSLQFIKRTGQIKDVPISEAAKVFLGFNILTNKDYFKLILKKHSISVYINDKQTFKECYQTINDILQLYHRRKSVISITSNNVSSDSANKDNIPVNQRHAIKCDETFITMTGPTAHRNSCDIYMTLSDMIDEKCDETFITMTGPTAHRNSCDIYTKLSDMIDEMTNDDIYVLPNDNDESSDSDNKDDIPRNQENSIGGDETFITVTDPTAWLNRDLQLQELYANIYERQYNVPEYKNGADHLKERYDDLEKFKQKHSNLNITPNVFKAMEIRLETLNESGVKVEISDKLIASLKVKEIDKKLWITEVFEEIQGKLYVGDRIVEVNGIPTQTLFEFQTRAKHIDQIILTIQRIPNGKVFVFDKTKLKIDTIKEDGRKKRFVLTDCKKINESTDWQITEVNGRNAVNIFDSNSFQNIKSIMKSDFNFFTLIIHPCQFIRSVTGKLHWV